MKKTFLLFFAVLSLALVGCSKDDDGFNYDMETLIGKWRVTDVDFGKGTYTSLAYYPTYATFNSDGTYSGEGYFGNGKGTYEAKGNTITCFYDGEFLVSYDIISLEGNKCELKVSYYDGKNYKFKCKKQ